MDLYSLLNLDKNATANEIKSRYYELAKIHHPDVNEQSKDSLERFQKLQMAYTILSDKDKRAEYDQYKSRSYYENQFNESFEGAQGSYGGSARNTGNEEDWKKEEQWRKRNYSGYEWFWITPNQLILWAIIGVTTSNLYERWHLKQFKVLREMAFQHQMTQKYSMSCRYGTSVNELGQFPDLVQLGKTHQNYNVGALFIMWPIYIPVAISLMIVKMGLLLLLNPKLEEVMVCIIEQQLQQQSKPQRNLVVTH